MPAYEERQRKQQPELRLVGHEPEQETGERGPRVEVQQDEADQGCGQQPVLADQ